jgi:hypothetical protein
MDLRKTVCKCVDWIQLTPDRIWWHALVIMVMNLQGIYWPDEQVSASQKRTMYHGVCKFNFYVCWGLLLWISTVSSLSLYVSLHASDQGLVAAKFLHLILMGKCKHNVFQGTSSSPFMWWMHSWKHHINEKLIFHKTDDEHLQTFTIFTQI